MAVRYPGLGKGKVIDQQVLTIDMAPSLLELTGAPALNKIDGRSWVSLVKDRDTEWRRSWFYYYNYEKQFPYTPNVRGIRTADWKYVHYPHGDGGPDRHLAELYDLRKDAGELKNLINDPGSASELGKLKKKLAELMAATGLTPETDRMPIDEGIKQELPDQKIR